MIEFPIWALAILGVMSIGFIISVFCYAMFEKKLRRADKKERNEKETKGEYIK